MAVQTARLKSHKRAFTTDDGRLGWGPPHMEVGDIVCIILGYGMPVILRQVSENVYIYIGNCFVVVIMAREAMDGITADSPTIRDFHLV